MLITALAKLRPEKVKRLVYLSAFLLPPGITPRALAQVDTESILSSALQVDEQRRVVMIKPEAAKAVFYADSTDEDATWATSLLVPEPLRTQAQGETLSSSPSSEIAWDAVSRVYIECLKDKALGPITQKKCI
jgi:pimeloyl-ACP methyl ester carboxylesterase